MPKREALEEAIGYDREALTLAVDPLASEGIRVQLATHIRLRAATSEEAKSLLDEVLRKGPRGDPLILANARVQRAVILRSMGRSQDALSDLGRALQAFHALSSVTQEFATNLELARTLRARGHAPRGLGRGGAGAGAGRCRADAEREPRSFACSCKHPCARPTTSRSSCCAAKYDAAVAVRRPAAGGCPRGPGLRGCGLLARALLRGCGGPGVLTSATPGARARVASARERSIESSRSAASRWIT